MPIFVLTNSLGRVCWPRQAVEAVRRLTALASPFMAERMYDLDARHAVESRWCPITNAKAPF